MSYVICYNFGTMKFTLQDSDEFKWKSNRIYKTKSLFVWQFVFMELRFNFAHLTFLTLTPLLQFINASYTYQSFMLVKHINKGGLISMKPCLWREWTLKAFEFVQLVSFSSMNFYSLIIQTRNLVSIKRKLVHWFHF